MNLILISLEWKRKSLTPVALTPPLQSSCLNPRLWTESEYIDSGTRSRVVETRGRKLPPDFLALIWMDPPRKYSSVTLVQTLHESSQTVFVTRSSLGEYET